MRYYSVVTFLYVVYPVVYFVHKQKRATVQYLYLDTSAVYLALSSKPSLVCVGTYAVYIMCS